MPSGQKPYLQRAWHASAIPLLVAVGLLGGSAFSEAQTLNMSVDLVRLGIASRNLTPNDPSLDAQPLFAAAVGYVRTHC